MSLHLGVDRIGRDTIFPILSRARRRARGCPEICTNARSSLSRERAQLYALLDPRADTCDDRDTRALGKS